MCVCVHLPGKHGRHSLVLQPREQAGRVVCGSLEHTRAHHIHQRLDAVGLQDDLVKPDVQGYEVN